MVQISGPVLLLSLFFAVTLGMRFLLPDQQFRLTHLIDALHSAFLQVCFGTKEVGMLCVIQGLLEINVNTICGPGCGH